MLDTYLLSGEPAILAAVSAFTRSPAYQSVRTNFTEGHVPPGHNVIFYENIRVPALLSPWTGNPLDLTATVNALQTAVMVCMACPSASVPAKSGTPAWADTRNIETCDVAASMWTYLSLLRVTGQAQWSGAHRANIL